MHQKLPFHIQPLLAALIVFPLLSLANEADKPVADPKAQPHQPAPATTSAEPANAQTPAKTEPETAKTEESSSKGLVVHRAPDFCMKKDPPPHCSE